MADQHRFRLENRLPDDLQARVTQRRAGLDHISDHVSDAEPDCGLDSAVQTGHFRVDALVGEVLGYQAGVRRGDPSPVEVAHVVRRAWMRGEPERRPRETERQDLVRGGTAVEEQVAAGDADIEAS